MGGVGSGRWGVKETIDAYRVIDVRRWQRDGLLGACQSFEWQWSRNNQVVGSIRVHTEVNRLKLSYRYRRAGGEWQEADHFVRLVWTPCNLGGHRPWFVCPAQGCGRRVALLYGGVIFACRRCYRLSYPSQREVSDDRAWRRLEKVREALGWQPGVTNGPGGKPKGMHWRTFKRLRAKHDALAESLLDGGHYRSSIAPKTTQGADPFLPGSNISQQP